MTFLKFQILFMVNYLFYETKGPFTKGLGKNDTCKLYMQLWTQLGPGNVTSQQFSNMVYIVLPHYTCCSICTYYGLGPPQKMFT